MRAIIGQVESTPGGAAGLGWLILQSCCGDGLLGWRQVAPQACDQVLEVGA